MGNGQRITINDRDYRLNAVLSSGAGSYGQVWAATDAAGRAVAIKLINAEAMTQVDPALHGHWRAHLEREINFLRGLDADQSRHVVALLDHGVVDGQPALVLERLQANLGQWLANRRREGAPPLDLAQILDWAEQILDGLDVVHRAGFVYRDLKFSNLLVGDDGARLKLADFGSLKREDGDNTRSFIGTPATMAPEQVLPARQGEEGWEYAVDYRADYYALGLLLFALFTGQPTTAAQRRLGQLLALHGQAGAGQQGVRLGGMNDEERELLRRSIEFWTVPARPEQGGGAAALLVKLIDRLLARDPAERPADALEIRAALDMARVAPCAAPTLTPDWNTPLPTAEPPNWHPRRSDRPPPWFRQRWALLTGAMGLAGALAWAMVHPGSRIGSDQAEPLSAVIAPPIADIAKPVEPAAPTKNPVTSSSSPQVSPVATSEPPPTVAAPVAETPEPPPTVAAPVAETPEPPPTVAAPVAKTPEPVDVAPRPVRLAPAKPRFTPAPVSPTKPRAVATPHPSTAPAAVEPHPPVRAKPAISLTPPKPAPAPAVADRPAAVERPETAKRTSAAPTAAPRIAKPTPPPSTPVAPEPSQRPPATARTAPTPRDSGPSRPDVRARPSATPRPASKAAESVARAEPPRRIASRPEPAPALPPIKLESRPEPAPALPPIKLESRPEPAPTLPPIKLESRPEPAPALPPIKLESRPQSAPPAPLPIELVSRSRVAAPTTRPAPGARIEPKPKLPTLSAPPPPARSTDSVTQFREDTGRTAAAIGDWASRTSATIGKEVQRGVEAADQAVGRWAGRCNPGDGCGRNTAQVDRRDHWAGRHGSNTVSQQESPTRYDENDGFAKPPPRQYRDDYR